MTTKFKLTVAVFAAAVAVAPLAAQTAANAQARKDPTASTTTAGKDGWVQLFNGQDLTGWRGYKKADATGTRWKVEDGLLVLDPGTGQDTRGARDIVTTETFDNFDLRWEWKISQGGNSGVKYFVLEDEASAIGHEYQIIDDERHADAKIGPHRQTAAFYDVLQAADRPMKPAGEWNVSEVRAHGTHVEHWLNGKKVLAYELDSPALREAIAKSKFKDIARFGKPQKGYVLIQDHGNQVWYRKIEIKRLK